MSSPTMAAEQHRSTRQSSRNCIKVPITIDPPLDESASADSAPADAAAGEPPGSSAGSEDWEQSIRTAVRTAAASQGFSRGQIGVMVTDDPTIHEINRRHLDHDYPTDVISFPYHRDGGEVEGELVVSLCTARRWAAQIACDWRSELLLYVVHGTLHICGLEDSTADQQQQMRAAERAVLTQLGVPDAERLGHAFANDASAQDRHDQTGAVQS